MTQFLPANEAELREIIHWAAGEKRPLQIRGAGTKQGIGRPVDIEHSVSTTALAGITLYEPEELVLTAGAGTPLREIETELEKRGQRLAFEPLDFSLLFRGTPGCQTLGGVIAANLSGPGRLSAGAARDHLLGFRAVSGRGESFKSGGRVVKNVTGYDLSKLMAGSWGTLAVMWELTVKVLPRPETTATLIVPGQTPDLAVQTMSEALGSGYGVSASAWLPADLPPGSGATGGSSATALRVEGSRRSVAVRLDELIKFLGAGTKDVLDAAASDGLWAYIRNIHAFADASSDAVWRVSVPPMAGAAVIAAFPAARGFMDWAGGLVWLSLPPTLDVARKLRAAVATLGGHATLIRADASLRSEAEVFPPLSDGLAKLTSRVKHSFDPHGVLNPGRLYREF